MATSTKSNPFFEVKKSFLIAIKGAQSEQRLLIQSSALMFKGLQRMP